ncbi:MAG TPA: hypothetical protein VMU22_09700 [Rhizomicrobium sp.]|nr:hypothetical protein [Rhizomicrobium sp.]
MAEGALQSPVFLIFLFLGFWIAALAVFRRYWYRTPQGKEWRQYRDRLSLATRRRLVSIQWLILIVSGVAVLAAAIQFRRHLHANEEPGDASPLAIALITVSSYLIASVFTWLLTNVVWWLTPSMRIESRTAREGLSAVTFRNGIKLFMLQAAIVIPICLAQIYLGSVMR